MALVFNRCAFFSSGSWYSPVRHSRRNAWAKISDWVPRGGGSKDRFLVREWLWRLQYRRDQRKGHIEPLWIGDFAPVSISLNSKNELLFTFTSWAGMPVNVKNNVVTIDDPLVERNFSDRAFEVVDREGKPIFQMISEDTHVTLNGVFPTPIISKSTGKPVMIWVSKQTGVTFASNMPKNFDLKPIFKYPAWKYRGMFAD